MEKPSTKAIVTKNMLEEATRDSIVCLGQFSIDIWERHSSFFESKIIYSLGRDIFLIIAFYQFMALQDIMMHKNTLFSHFTFGYKHITFRYRWTKILVQHELKDDPFCILQ